MLAVRPLDEKGNWQYKTQKEYLCLKNEEEQGYEQVSKYPKNTKYGRQNPIAERWNSEEQPTIHEGVVARALEKKGIVSDRCELNRQIKSDNALLRELKTAVKKLMQTVKVTVPTLAEAIESLRANMITFRYQIRYASFGKHKLSESLNVL